MNSTIRLLLITGLMLQATAGFARSPIETQDDPQIFSAIRSIDYVNINLLLDGGINIDTVDDQGNTPLMVAANIANPRILDIILAHDPSVNKQNFNGTTALMIAAKTGQLQVVKKLLKYQADISIQDHKNNTAVALAAKYGHRDIVAFLQSHQNQRVLNLQ